MEDAKQAKPEPQPIPAEQAAEISGGADCSATATSSTGVTGTQVTAPTVSQALIDTYEGYVDLASHIIGRVAGTNS